MNALGSQYIANYTFTDDEIGFNGNMSLIDSWVNQSYGLAVKYVYPAALKNGNLTDTYAQQCKKVVDRQLALAGQRMANVLKFIFANK